MKLLILSSLVALTTAQETIYGVYIFHRHGDRTPKILPPANLTALGYQEILTSGQYYRNRYVSSSSSLKLQGLSPDIAKASQLTVTAPSDTVLQDSAVAFLQGLYPPLARSETLRNGTVIQAPMSGYQLIPVGLTSSGTGSEDNGWLQDASGCKGAVLSSNNYFLSTDYQSHVSATQQFYQNLEPVINGTFSSAQATFKNAFTSRPPNMSRQ
jgi:Histidine phosphatase superfamily (branch 2)